VVDVSVADGPIDIFDEDGVSEKFQKFLFLGMHWDGWKEGEIYE
jgi:hypothetical protein